MKIFIKLISLFWMCNVFAADIGDASVPEPDAGLNKNVSSLPLEDYSMFDLMQLASKASSMGHSEEEIFEISELVVIGYIDSITEGRSILDTEAPTPSPMKTSLFKIEVTDVIKGDAGKYVYFEYVTGSMPSEYLDAAKYQGELLLFLTPADFYRPTKIITNSDRGFMREVDTLYASTSDNLLFVDHNLLVEKYRNSSQNINDTLEKDSSGNVIVD